MVAALADAGRHGEAASRHGDLRRDAPVAPADRFQPHRRDPVPRHRARRRPPPDDQAVRGERRPRGARRRPGVAGRAGALAGIRLRLPGEPGTRARRGRESAMEVGHAADFRAPPALPRHRREAPRLPPRTLDSREVDRAAPALRARLRARRPPRCRRTAERRARRDAVERRAGVHVRAARPAAQHRQLVAGRDRLGERPAARVGTQARVRDDAANHRGILCRPHEQSAGWCAGRAASPGRCFATSTRLRFSISSSARSTRCARPKSASRATPQW